jgi:hypothetical protein
MNWQRREISHILQPVHGDPGQQPAERWQQEWSRYITSAVARWKEIQFFTANIPPNKKTAKHPD